MYPAEVNVGGDFAVGQGAVEMFGPGLRDRQVADAIKVLVFDGDFPAPAGLVGFLADDVVHDFMPGAGGQMRIGAVHVDTRQGEVEVGLALAVVAGGEKAKGLLLVAGFEAGLFAGDFVFEVVNTPGTFDQSELLLHRFLHGWECEAAGTAPIREQWASVDRAETEFCQGCQTGEESGEDPNPRVSNSLRRDRLELEARVGIGQKTPVFQGPFNEIQPNPKVSEPIFFNHLVHVLVHVGARENYSIFRRRS
ncbi:MAG TPA: hypothetical protein VKY92_21810 [Verrucomicrobiae bacterium]|nr:hypothetical protein [Verrucomicrobiae bacterium]